MRNGPSERGNLRVAMSELLVTTELLLRLLIVGRERHVAMRSAQRATEAAPGTAVLQKRRTPHAARRRC